jgi:RNA polymerase sigma-70 factor, ECF subfamily
MSPASCEDPVQPHRHGHPLRSPAVEGERWNDDGALIDALLAGDEAAFAHLISTYAAPLRRFARQYVSTDASADEVVQEVWLAVITNLAQFERRSSLRTWLYRVLLNVARSRGVREHRSLPFSTAAGALADDEPAVGPEHFRPADSPSWPGHWAIAPEAWAPPPDQEPGRRETLDIVAGALEMLPAAQREVVTLRDVLGWSSDEVCDALGVTAGNQRVLLHRARARLRAALDDHFEAVSA